MSLLRRIPARVLEDKKLGNTLGQLETSCDIRKTLYRIRNHQWRKSDIFIIIQTCILICCFSIIRNPSFIFRLIIGFLLALAVLMPITSQFFFPALPILIWLVLFYTCQFIPHEWRPRIYVRVLPALETILYGGNLSDVLSSKTSCFLDILAWIPYGLIHFGAPFVLAALLFLFAPPKTLPCYGFAFGWMNIIGVSIQILFPCAPPWYQILYGLQPANYSMPGSPGGLARVDQILGLNMYTGSFTASPQVFGAFPSLHSGSAVMDALFACYLFPSFTPVFVVYVFWVWWSTMYLTHHYFVDLIGGAILSFIVFYAVRRVWLPQIQHDRFSRWSYEYIETGEEQQAKFRKSVDGEYELHLYNKSLSESKSTFADTKFAKSDKHTGITTVAPIQTNIGKNSTPILSAPIKMIPHSHNKSSSYNLYGSEVYATSASNTSGVNGSSSLASSLSGSNTNSSIISNNSKKNGSGGTSASTCTSPSAAPSATSLWALSSINRAASTSPVDDSKRSLFNKMGPPLHDD